MKILELPLKKEWYNLIECGEKREEYRVIKPYWTKRFIGVYGPQFYHRLFYLRAKYKDYTHVLFRYGYTKRKMQYEIDEITVGRGRTDWGAPADKDVFIIKFH